MEQPVALDLFSGRGGWTDGLLAAGFRVIGFDIKEYEGYKGEFVKRDILEMTTEEIRSYSPRFICCSSPCEQFSVHGMRHFHKNPKHPDLGIKLFDHAKHLCESSGVPYIMENVRAAQAFIGRSVNHCGPFHMWGTGVPAIIPPEAYQEKKGQAQGNAEICKQLKAEGKIEELRQYRSQFYFAKTSSGSEARKKIQSEFATIPFSLSSYVGRIAMENYGRL